MSDLTGQRFGNYRLIRLLGQGGFADTYLGEQIYVGTSAAVKIVQTQLAQGDQGAFFGEARTIAHLTHPNIVRLLDFGVETSRNIPYLAMDYAPNGTLRQRHSRGEVVPVSRVVPYLKQVAAALQYAHEQKVIHRDVKPENMLVGAGNEILLADFGIAVVESTHKQTQNPIAGTIYYMAPEQIRGKPLPASDQYALAVVVYGWLCGGPPFTGSYTEIAVQHECSAPPSLRERVATIPVDVEQVVLTALAKDPHQRFKDVQTFAYAFEQASHMGSSPPLHPSLAAWQMNTPPEQVPHPYALQGDSGSPPVSAEQAPQTAYGAQPVRGQGSPASDSSGSTILSPYSSDLRNPHTPVPAVHESFEPRPTPQFTPPLNTPLHTPVQEPLQVPHALLQGVSAAPPPVWGQAQSTSPTPSGSSQRWRPSTRLTVLLGAVVLLILGGILLASITPLPVPFPRPVNETATATAIARQEIYRQATSGTPLISDSLSTPDNYGWSHWQGLTGKCDFVDGTYHSRAQARYFVACYAQATTFTDFAYQVEVTIISGDAGGIAFRKEFSDNLQAYYFYIRTDGRYAFIKRTLSADKKYYPSTTLAGGISPAIRQGLNQPNLVTVVARGSSFYFYVNKQYVTTATDDSYRSGSIGVGANLSANSTDTSGAEASFRNLQVWQL